MRCSMFSGTRPSCCRPFASHGINQLRNSRAWLLAQLVPFVSADRRREASFLCLRDLQVAHGTRDVPQLVRMCAPCFDTDDLASVVAAVRSLPEKTEDDDWPQVQAIAFLANRLHEAGINEPIVTMVEWVFWHKRVLGSLAHWHPTRWIQEFLDRLLTQRPSNWIRSVLQLLPCLTSVQTEAALRACGIAFLLEYNDISWRAVARDLNDSLFDELMDTMIRLPDAGDMFQTGWCAGPIALGNGNSCRSHGGSLPSK